MTNQATLTAFSGHCQVASGTVHEMVRETKSRLDAGQAKDLLIFDDRTGRQVDFDFRGTLEEVVARLDHHPLFAAGPGAKAGHAGPGRPRLGVVSREVSLLPRHWDWLERQPNGISGALRRLVDEARGRDPEGERARAALDAASAFMFAMAGNLPGYEEASRALWARDRARFEELIAEWPEDVRRYALRLASEGLGRP